MTIYTPYTYLIGWSWLDVWYYGVEYSNSKSKIAHPENLWTIYFTTSDWVAEQRWLYGEPDIIEVRCTFETAEVACDYESLMINIFDMVKDPRFLNKHDPKGGWYNHGGYKHRKTRSKSHCQLLRDLATERTNELISQNKHIFQGDGSFQRKNTLKLVEAGIHNWQGDGTSQREMALARSRNNTHNFQNPVKKECPHCHRLFDKGNYVQWHGDKCKMKPAYE